MFLLQGGCWYVEKIPGHVRNWGSGGEGRGGMSAAEGFVATVQCNCSAVQCKLHCATAGRGEVEINGCVAGRFKKRGLSMEGFGAWYG